MTPDEENKTIEIEGINVLYTNADQLPNKLDELKTRIDIEKPHIIAIVEVNTKSCKNKPELIIFNIDGYTLFHRNVSQNGRGIVIYIQKSITNVTEIDPKIKFEEQMFLSIPLKAKDRLLLGCIYRSDSGSEENNDQLLSLMKETVKMNHSHVLILGDFNYKEIEWGNWTTHKSEDSREYKFIQTVRDTYYHQHVMLPTRSRVDHTPSTLDLVFTSERNMIDDIDYQSPIGKSDHNVLIFKLKLYHSVKYKPKKIYNYNKGDYEKMRSLLCINWDMELENLKECPEKQWLFIKEKIIDAKEKCIPSYNLNEQNKQTRKGNVNITPSTRERIRKKHRCWTRFQEAKKRHQSNVDDKHKEYRTIRNEVTRLMDEARANKEREIAEKAKQNSKVMWKYIKSKTKVKEDISPLYDKRSKKLTTDETEKAELLSDFFQSVFTKEPHGDIPKPTKRNLKSPPLEDIKITEEIVLKKLNKLDITKSQGPDEIGPRILKELSREIVKPLTILYKNLLKQGKVPDEWKRGIITAIYKKGDKKDPGNYRPISLTCIICKILESIIWDAIVEHMLTNRFFSKYQYGFISKRSASLQLLKVLEIWSNILDNGGTIDNINMDFMKAFDTVPHKRLIAKIKSYGICGEIIRWIEEYLKNRKQCVNVNGYKSQWRDVLSGIPQGSVLGALLFVIYINDLPENIKSYIFLFADDAKFFKEVSCKEDAQEMQVDLNTLDDWSNTWLLKFHPDKCVNLRICLNNHQEKYKYMLGNNELKDVNKVKDLGIIVDSKLKFDQHIATKVNKANAVMGTIKRTFKHLDLETFKLLYCSQVRSQLEYGNQVWCPHLKKDINLIESVQRRATKCVRQIRHLSYQERLETLQIPTLTHRRARGDMIEAWKILNIYDKEITPTLLKPPQDVTRGHTQKLYRSQSKKLHPKHHSFNQRVVNPWNSLTENVVSSPTLNVFKNRLDQLWKTRKYSIEQ